ncbi:MAG TPA: sigma-70 family RNA polymerase sigma factor [Nocardioides sp.]|nr:sigma-70 family RNA polymerase sigma factor [Nocardioides sp.]
MEAALVTLVPAARAGDGPAWDAIVERFAPLVEAIVRAHRLGRADRDDVSQTVWLHLVEHLGELRDPAALPGWIRTTTAHECVRLLGRGQRQRSVDPADERHLDTAVADEAEAGAIAADERRLLRRALAQLPPPARDLMLLMVAEPSLSYAELATHLHMPVGSIGPTRARALEQLRRSSDVRGCWELGA